jgi:hypothetical protein
MKNKDEKPPRDTKKVVFLKDLAPRGDVKGGAAKVPFGAEMTRKGIGKERTSRTNPP